MASNISFSHIINPFPAPEGSEHGIASRIMFESMRVAVGEARRAGVPVEVRAVVLPGDEPAVEAPAVLAPRLARTVQEIRPMRPRRPLPLIADILARGGEGAQGSHVIFTNMDIILQPHFYAALRDLIMNRFGEDVPFIVYRRNLDARFREVDQLNAMYGAEGSVAYGFDCFVFSAKYLRELDLGNCCIGTGHFDNLLFLALDAASGFRMKRVGDLPLTFHIGNEIEWSRHVEYLEHNLEECMAAIARMQERYQVPANGSFSRMMKTHFLPNTRWDSVLFRRLKRLPGLGEALHHVKKRLGRSH